MFFRYLGNNPRSLLTVAFSNHGEYFIANPRTTLGNDTESLHVLFFFLNKKNDQREKNKEPET